MRINNFRSIEDCDIALGPLTILIGPNGSGKSNFLHALDLVADALNGGLEAAVLRRGGIVSLLSRWASDDPNARLRIEIEVSISDQQGATYSIELARSAGAARIVEERCTVRRSPTGPAASDVEVANYVIRQDGSEWHDARGVQFVPRIVPDGGTQTLVLPHLADHVPYGTILRALRGLAFYSLHDAPMRKPQEIDGSERLRADGSNVAGIYRRLQSTNQFGWRPADAVTDVLRVVTPGVSGISVSTIDNFEVLRFEQVLERAEAPVSFSASEMSYGTLRTLGVLVALYQGSMAGGSSVTLVELEEPESAVHPGAAPLLLEAMQEAALSTQVFATSHSAAMLDQDDLDVSMLRVVSRHGGRTTIGAVDTVSQSLIAAGLFTAGELMRSRQFRPERDVRAFESRTAVSAS
ncbi:MAG: AAA family ATPase [Chloroflexi bacterium]|nr:AAA family ATPase [Chloroflexota bacterium]